MDQGPLPPPKKKGGGCLLYGCLTVVVLIILISVGAYFLFKSVLNRMVNEFGDTEPIPIESAEVNPAEFEVVRARVQQFAEDVKANRASSPLVLSAHDINSLIVGHPEFEFLKGKVFVDIKGDDIIARMSVPLEPFGYKDRYFNALLRCAPELRRGELKLRCKEAEIKRQPASEELLRELESDRGFGKGFEEALYDNPEARDFVRKIESAVVQNGKVVVTPLSGHN